jgi:hypothetical protein
MFLSLENMAACDMRNVDDQTFRNRQGQLCLSFARTELASPQQRYLCELERRPCKRNGTHIFRRSRKPSHTTDSASEIVQPERC